MKAFSPRGGIPPRGETFYPLGESPPGAKERGSVLQEALAACMSYRGRDPSGWRYRSASSSAAGASGTSGSRTPPFSTWTTPSTISGSWAGRRPGLRRASCRTAATTTTPPPRLPDAARSGRKRALTSSSRHALSPGSVSGVEGSPVGRSACPRRLAPYGRMQCCTY